jgi:hypothetical protein
MCEEKVCLPRSWEDEKNKALQRCTFVTYQRAAASKAELQLVSGAFDGAGGGRGPTTCAVRGQYFFAGAEVA